MRAMWAVAAAVTVAVAYFLLGPSPSHSEQAEFKIPAMDLATPINHSTGTLQSEASELARFASPFERADLSGRSSVSSIHVEYGRLLPLAQQGDAEAQYQIAQLLHDCAGYSSEQRSEQGIAPECADMPEQPGTEIESWLRAAATQGHVAAQFELGVLLSNSEGTDLITDAASANHLAAQLHLAESTLHSDPPDLAESYYWFSRAALLSDTTAISQASQIERLLPSDVLADIEERLASQTRGR